MNKIVLFFVLFSVAFASNPIEEDKLIENQLTDYIDIIKCFFNNEPLMKDIKTIIELITTDEFENLLPLIFQLSTDGSVAIKECFTFTLKGPRDWCIQNCMNTYFLASIGICKYMCNQ